MSTFLYPLCLYRDSQGVPAAGLEERGPAQYGAVAQEDGAPHARRDSRFQDGRGPGGREGGMGLRGSGRNER